jgi:hypothetical protein
LDNQYPQRWIGRGGPHHWPARSPDLNHLSAADLRVPIQEAFVSVTEEMITNATTRSLLRREQLCIQMNGDHFFNIITYLNKWFFLESPFLLFYFEVIIFCNCQVLMLMTDKRQRIFISGNVKIPVAQTFY